MEEPSEGGRERAEQPLKQPLEEPAKKPVQGVREGAEKLVKEGGMVRRSRPRSVGAWERSSQIKERGGCREAGPGREGWL